MNSLAPCTFFPYFLTMIVDVTIVSTIAAGLLIGIAEFGKYIYRSNRVKTRETPEDALMGKTLCESYRDALNHRIVNLEISCISIPSALEEIRESLAAIKEDVAHIKGRQAERDSRERRAAAEG